MIERSARFLLLSRRRELIVLALLAWRYIAARESFYEPAPVAPGSE